MYDLRVRYVTIDARWAKGVKLPLVAGDPLTPQTISAALEALKQRIDDNALHGYGFRTKGELGILHIDVEYDTSPSSGDPPDGPRTVGVIFHPYYVRFSLERVGDNVLPIPRSPHPTFYDNVPAPLLALNPSFGVFSDRAFGTALGGSVNGDLLNLFSPARIDPAVAPTTRRLEAHAQGLKAVDEPFYRAAAGLLYREQLGGPLLRELSLRANYDGVDEPLGRAEHTRTSALGGVGLLLKLAPNARLSLDTGFRWTDDRVEAAAPEDVSASGRACGLQQGDRGPARTDDRARDARRRRHLVGRRAGVRALLRRQLLDAVPLYRRVVAEPARDAVGAADSKLR